MGRLLHRRASVSSIAGRADGRRRRRGRRADAPTTRPLVSIEDIRAAADRLARGGDPDAAGPVRTARAAGWSLKAESLQPIGAFKIRGAYATISGALARGAGPRASSRTRRAITPRASRGPRACSASRPWSSCRPTRRPSSASGSRPTAPRSSSSGRPATSASRSPSGSPPSAGSRSSRRSTTTGSSPARARSGWRSSRTLPDLAAVLVPIGGGGLASGVAIAVQALRPSARVIGVEPELAADAQESLARGRDRPLGRRRDVSRTIADGTRTQAIGRRPFAHLRVDPRRRRHRQRGGDRRGVRLVAEEAGWSSSRRGAGHRRRSLPRARGGPRRTGRRRRGGRQRRERRPGPLSRVPGRADPVDRLGRGDSRPRSVASRSGESARSRDPDRGPLHVGPPVGPRGVPRSRSASRRRRRQDRRR